jgi:hypothetical protein
MPNSYLGGGTAWAQRHCGERATNSSAAALLGKKATPPTPLPARKDRDQIALVFDSVVHSVRTSVHHNNSMCGYRQHQHHCTLHSPITCHGVSSVPVQQEHDEESGLPKRRCSNSLLIAGKEPPHNFTPRVLAPTPPFSPRYSG